MCKHMYLRCPGKRRGDNVRTKFYDIAKELQWYNGAFKGKTVLCNCDDLESAFYQYFARFFAAHDLKRLIATSYKLSADSCELAKVSWLDSPNPMLAKTYPLKGSGDYRSGECIDILKEADIVVTQPPISMLEDFIKQLVDYDKKFILLGSKNAVKYKGIFSLIKAGTVKLGCRGISGTAQVICPEDETKYDKIEDGEKLRTMRACWFTNVDYLELDCKLLPLYNRYSPEVYPKYDNYNAINVDTVADIPADYEGVMGVPITFIDRCDRNRFEILGLDRYMPDNPEPGHGFKVNGKPKYDRMLVRNRYPGLGLFCDFTKERNK